MWNEHFGIGVVEMMAAGLITIAHNSGGPKSDIVVTIDNQRTGLLADTAEEYAHAMAESFSMNAKDTVQLRSSAQASASRFSDEVFSASFKEALLDSRLLF